MAAIYQLELRRLCRGPSLWLLAGLLQIVLAWYCLSALENFLGFQARLSLEESGPGLSDWLLARYAYPGTLALMATVAPLAMQSLAAERRDDSLSLLLVAPVSPARIALGKFLALASVLVGLSALIPANLLLIATLAPLDTAAIAVAWLNIAALAATAGAIGLFCSSLTASPATAAFACSAVLLVLWLIAGAEATLFGTLPLNELALPTHLGRALQGLLHGEDFAYYAVVSAAMLALTTRQLANLRHWGNR